MFAPTERPPASWHPRLAASMMPGPAPVMTAKPASARLPSQLASERVVRVLLGEPRGAEDGDDRTTQVEQLHPVQELEEDADSALHVVAVIATPLQKRRLSAAELLEHGCTLVTIVLRHYESPDC